MCATPHRSLHCAAPSLRSLRHVSFNVLELSGVDGPPALLANERNGIEGLHAILHECNGDHHGRTTQSSDTVDGNGGRRNIL